MRMFVVVASKIYIARGCFDYFFVWFWANILMFGKIKFGCFSQTELYHRESGKYRIKQMKTLGCIICRRSK
jgi:hypothetical protein